MEREVFVKGRVIGKVIDGVFTQRITDRHIFRQMNAKGMDVDLHHALRGICHTWRLVHKQTKRVLSIDYEKIEVVGKKMRTGAGEQIMVGLGDFNEDVPALQERFI